jgi:Uma2 family endonuclease
MTAAAAAVEAPAGPFRDPGEFGFTVADLHALPEHGPRYELIDGSIIVSPSATMGHNAVARWIAYVLEETNPSDEYVIGTDQSTSIDDHSEPRPDIVVARAEHIETTPFPIADALLVAEVISPTSVLRDTETKRALYARAGVPSYWIIVPEREKGEIALAELVLDGGTYRYATHYTTDMFRTDRPWPLTIDLPALSQRRQRLLDRGARTD